MARATWTRSDFFEGLSRQIGVASPEQQRLWEHYKYNPWDFISEQCDTITDIDPPLGKFRQVRMKLFPAQVDLIKKIVTFEEDGSDFYIDDTHLEKSRQMGMSWILTGIGLWAIIFWGNVHGLYLSRKESEVDDGGEKSTDKSLFGKMRFQWKHMDEWLKERAPIEFKFLYIVNPTNNSWIMGESANPNAGRGGTFKFIVCDEWAFVPNSEAVAGAIDRACPRGKILNSTPFGTGNHYARIKRMHVRGKDTGYQFIRLHWSQNPNYAKGIHVNPKTGRLTSPWYEATTRTMTPEKIASELEISYNRSMTGLVYPEFNVDIDAAGSEEFDAACDYDPRKGQIYVGWDFGLNDPTALLLCQKNELGGYDVFNELQMDGQPAKNFVPYIREWERTYEQVFEHFGDVAGNQREKVTGSSVIEEMALEGIFIRSQKQAVQDGISLIRVMHQHRQIRIHSRCLTYIECKTNYHYPLDPQGNPREGIEIPQHDWASHMMDAERYLAYGLFYEGEIDESEFEATGSNSEGEADWVTMPSDAEIFGVSY